MNPEKNAASKYDNGLLISGIVGFFLIAALAGYAINEYIKKFEDGSGFSDSREVWGQFGDFVGGLLNPAIGALTVYLLLVSVYIQRKELRSSIAEMKESNKSLILQDVRQTFFTWLNSYREIVGGSEGRDLLRDAAHTYIYAHNMTSVFNRKIRATERDYHITQFHDHGIPPEEIKEELKVFMMVKWEQLYKKQAHHIGAMFRTLYRLIRWIDEQDDNVLSPAEKYQYISIARAQLSDIETDYLYFNAMTDRGRAFIYLINKYAIFDNIVFEGKPHLQLMQDIQNPTFDPSAFDSDIAKAKLKSTAEI